MANKRRWTREEEQRLLRQIRVYPQNLHKCFVIVGEEIGRSDKAVSHHWYKYLSKEPDALCFFTASSQHVSRNRKNGMGVKSTNTIWQRLLRIIRNLK